MSSRIVGYAYVLPSPDDNVPAGTAELSSLYVTEDVAGTGVAHTLIDAAIEQARAVLGGLIHEYGRAAA